MIKRKRENPFFSFMKILVAKKNGKPKPVLSGWWFGTGILFSVHLEETSQLTNIFQRG